MSVADAELAAKFPGDRADRQPVHTVYVPANRYRADVCRAWGARALAVLDEHAELFAELVDDPGLVDLVRDKLAREPIEDLRIDFEDGYGTPSNAVEDADVVTAARALASTIVDGVAPPFRGIRIKSFEAATRRRGLRTLASFVHGLVDAGAGVDGFVITLPKVSSVDQVEAMGYACAQLERATGVDRLRFEIQVETPQSIVGPDGTALVARMVHAAEGRCVGLHFGTYDYSAYCGIAAEYQSMTHPAAEHAKLVMQAAAAGTGVRLSDGSTNVLPVGDADAVRAGWRLHLSLVRRSLEHGFYQGWDLHPAQLPTRFAATFAFYRDGLARATARLRDYLGKTRSAIADEPATVRALADYVLRALHCGAVDAPWVEARTGLSVARIVELARPCH
ncbi:MAG: aldolase [Sciscionella sp.]|nr:aldolase [Sciscionella sp.]